MRFLIFIVPFFLLTINVEVESHVVKLGDLSKDAIEAAASLGLTFKHFKTTEVGFVSHKYFK